MAPFVSSSSIAVNTKSSSVANYVAYYRVSTQRQGLGLDAQRANVLQHVATDGGTLVQEFSEKETGKNNDRRQLTKALQFCKETGATLLIAKLDRLSRDVEFIFHLKNCGVQFVALDLPDFNTLTLGIFATIAQHERELISQRTKAALAAKKAKGAKLGRPACTWSDDQRAASLNARRAASRSNAANVAAFGFVSTIRKNVPSIAFAALAEALNAAGLTTAKGGKWQGVQVKRLITLFA